MFKSNLIAGIIGIALLCGFLGVMIFYVKALPLIAIIVLVVLLMIYDFVKTMREMQKNGADS